MGCHIATRSRKKEGNKKEIRVTVKSQMAQDAFDLFCQRAQEVITRQIDWTSVPFRRKARDKEEMETLASVSGEKQQSGKKEPFFCLLINPSMLAFG